MGVDRREAAGLQVAPQAKAFSFRVGRNGDSGRGVRMRLTGSQMRSRLSSTIWPMSGSQLRHLLGQEHHHRAGVHHDVEL